MRGALIFGAGFILGVGIQVYGTARFIQRDYPEVARDMMEKRRRPKP